MSCSKLDEVVLAESLDIFVNLGKCELFSLSLELEKGSGMDHSHSQTRPADILVPSWSIGKSAACDSQL